MDKKEERYIFLGLESYYRLIMLAEHAAEHVDQITVGRRLTRVGSSNSS